MPRTRFAASVLTISLLGAPAHVLVAQNAPTAEASATESWIGSATLPNGAELDFALHLTRGSDPSATIDIPSQGAIGLPLEVIELEGNTVSLRLGAPANADIVGEITGDELTGALKQAGMEFPIEMSRSTGEPTLNRPQHPEPPFPYDVQDVTFDSVEGVTLAGTLTLPKRDGMFPAAVLVTGSGPQDRDETLVGHKPFLVIADHLTRAGIAVLRYDDRGVAESTGNHAAATSDDFTDDALAAVRFLQEHPRIAPGKVGIVGHSEGGLVAPMAAARDTSVAYIIMLAGLGADGGEILVSQQGAITRAGGGTPAMVQTVETNMTELVEAMRAGGDPEAVAAPLRRVLAAQMVGATEEQIDQTLQQQVPIFTSPWMMSFAKSDPTQHLSRVIQPVLALFGELDLQVLPDVNAEPMRAALENAPTDDVTIVTLPGHNHLFQNAQTGSPAEYASIEETFSPNALEIVTSWITQRFAN